MQLTNRFEHALTYACLVHAGQTRKGTAVPYVSHLLAVAALAIEHGASEDEAIGALLHDAAEDAGGEGRLHDIRARFGDAVAGIVAGCTDTYEKNKPPWRERKEAYIRHLASASPSTLLVSCCDKLHNARSILADLRSDGDAVWARFNGGKSGTLWYYRALCDAFRDRGVQPRLLDELERTVAAIEELAGGQ
jgi:GTP pyrophosphokinase